MGKHTTQQPHHRLPTPRRSTRRTQKTNRRPRRKNQQTHPNTRRTPTHQRHGNKLHPQPRPLDGNTMRGPRRRIPHTPPQTIPTRRTPQPHLPPLTKHDTKKPRQNNRGFPICQTDHVRVAELHAPFLYVISLKGRTYKPDLSNWKPLYSTPAPGTFKSVKSGLT